MKGTAGPRGAAGKPLELSEQQDRCEWSRRGAQDQECRPGRPGSGGRGHLYSEAGQGQAGFFMLRRESETPSRSCKEVDGRERPSGEVWAGGRVPGALGSQVGLGVGCG